MILPASLLAPGYRALLQGWVVGSQSMVVPWCLLRQAMARGRVCSIGSSWSPSTGVQLQPMLPLSPTTCSTSTVHPAGRMVCPNGPRALSGREGEQRLDLELGRE